MGIEIERKFKVVKKLPKGLDSVPVQYIEQGYLNVTPAIRVRRQEERSPVQKGEPEGTAVSAARISWYMTYKGAVWNENHVQEEYNLTLDEESYRHLLAKADGTIIRKKRYLLPLNDDAFDASYISAHPELEKQIAEGRLCIELDVFEAPYEGLVIAEVEFPTEEAARQYHPAAMFTEEVTGDRRYSNAQLSFAQRDSL